MRLAILPPLSFALLGAVLLPAVAVPAYASDPDGFRYGQPYTAPPPMPAPSRAGARNPRWDGTSRSGGGTVYAGPATAWNGFYVGAHLGGGFGDSTFTDLSRRSVDADGFLGGLHAGFSAQYGQAVIGLEVDGSWTGVDGKRLIDPTTTGGVAHDWLGSVRGRLGYAFDRFHLYATGGLAMGEVDARLTTAAGTISASEFRTGWVVGGGLEMAIAPNLSGRIEALHYDFGGDRMEFSGTSTKVDSDVTTVRAGITLHLN